MKEMLNSAQPLFPNGAILPSMLAEHAKGLIETQTEFLRGLYAMSDAWFERRQKTARTSFDVALEISQCRDPAALTALYRRWLGANLDALADDTHDCTAQWMIVLRAFSRVSEAPSSSTPGAPRAERRAEAGRGQAAHAAEAIPAA